VLEGHTSFVGSLAWSPDSRRALSGAFDNTVRLWDLESGRCLRVFDGHTASILGLAWSADGRRAFSGDSNGWLWVWDLSEFVTEARTSEVALPTLALTQ
jgi:WD40 repeat protein